tara:strand:- start:5401 stop:5796 length:396 start_codon:yes stop_codon:yes gene_type:complete
MLTALIAPVSNLLGKFIEDKDMKNKLAHEVATMAENHANELAKGQIEINKAEASHKSIFVAGWRPFIGWTCGIALCWHFVLQPVTLFVCTYIGLTIPTLPEFDMGSLMTILGGLLGLGGLRTYEKQKGLTK